MEEEIINAAVSFLFPPETIVPKNCITAGCNLAQSRLRIREELKRIGYAPKEGEEGSIKDYSSEERINLIVKAALSVAGGTRTFIQNNLPGVADFYPALELESFYAREASESWPGRWQAAAELSGDDAATRVLQKTGRMVGLKSSDIWQALGDGAGGYDDALGNPFAPFAFNSGFRTASVAHVKAVELGLIKRGEVAKPARFLVANECAERFAAKLRQYLTKLENEEDQ
jgi:hypothetical protein